MTTARKMSLENEELRNCDYFAIILSCSYFTMDWSARVLIKTVNVVISPCCFAEDGTDLFVGASGTCSTIIFLTRPIKFLICGVVIAVVVFDAKAA